MEVALYNRGPTGGPPAEVGVQVTRYLAMGLPPSDTGAAHDTVALLTEENAAVIVTFTGGPGDQKEEEVGVQALDL